MNTDSYEQRKSPAPTPRKVLSPNIYKATPILGLVQAEFEQQRHDEEIENNEQTKIPRANANGDQWTRQNYDKGNFFLLLTFIL